VRSIAGAASLAARMFGSHVAFVLTLTRLAWGVTTPTPVESAARQTQPTEAAPGEHEGKRGNAVGEPVGVRTRRHNLGKRKAAYANIDMINAAGL
jgi:hypothetical protein